MSTEPCMSDFPLFIHGHGAVSAAGVCPPSLYRACLAQTSLPTSRLEHVIGGETISYLHRPVDAQALRDAMPKHPRLRRASNITKFAVTAAHQAIGAERAGRIQARTLRVGIILTLLNGCVNYSNRFFAEVLEDPSLASPILFPETVFNAPASHIAAYLGCDGPAYTMLGDSATWFSAMKVAAGWIADGDVDGCLVICAEETDWLTLEGLALYSRGFVGTEGAAAVYLEARPSEIGFATMHGPFCYHDSSQRRTAIADAWAPNAHIAQGLFIDGLTGVSRLDRAELAATASWPGERLSPTRVLGEGMGVRCGFQTTAAIEALRNGHDSATILASGGNQHAFSATIVRHIP
jgi:3-oxoacyl-[acyl-carrier-protein] synthase II